MFFLHNQPLGKHDKDEGRDYNLQRYLGVHLKYLCPFQSYQISGLQLCMAYIQTKVTYHMIVHKPREKILREMEDSEQLRQVGIKIMDSEGT